MLTTLLTILLFSKLCQSYNAFMDCPQDYDACTRYGCRKDDASRRSAHICSDWPYYAGGFPTWDGEKEYYDCTEWSTYQVADPFEAGNISSLTSTNTITKAWCNEWSTKEESGDEAEFGSCSCIESNGRYCVYWICSQTEHTTEYGSWESAYQCGSNDDGTPIYCYLDSDGLEREATQDYELTNCWCRNETLFHYCDNWYCEETKTDDFGDTITESEYYQCKHDEYQQISVYDFELDEEICWRWIVDVQSVKEFEVANCWCSEINLEQGDNAVCSKWRCDEEGMKVRYNSLWYMFILATILWPISGCGICMCFGGYCRGANNCLKNDPACLCWSICGFFIFCFAAISHGGFPCFVFWLGFSVLGFVIGVACYEGFCCV